MNLLLYLVALPVMAAEYYVSPVAQAGGNGSLATPWRAVDLFVNPDPAALAAGDTVWMLCGDYDGQFASYVTGTSGNRIKVRAWPGCAVRIRNTGATDVAGLSIYGQDAEYIGLTFTSTTTSQSDRRVSGNFAQGVYVYAVRVKLINCIIHDNSQAIGLWLAATDSEVNGNVIYNNGEEDSDRRHGHSVYTQNAGPGTHIIKGNVERTVEGGTFGLHCYGEAVGANTQYYDISYNVFTGKGLCGGNRIASNISFTYNQVFRPQTDYPEFQFGRDYTLNVAPLTISNNVLVGGFALEKFDAVTFASNRILAGSQSPVWEIQVRKGGHASVTYTPSANEYFLHSATENMLNDDFSPNSGYWRCTGTGGYNNWTATYGADTDCADYVSGGTPTANWTYYITNDHEARRCMVVFYNWTGASIATIDLSQCGFSTGDFYEVRDFHDYANILTSGAYAGSTFTVNALSTAVTAYAGTMSGYCWNTDCNSCNPVPGGCATHAAFTPSKDARFRVFMVRRDQTHYGAIPFSAFNSHPTAEQVRVTTSGDATMSDAARRPSATFTVAYNAAVTGHIPAFQRGKLWVQHFWETSGGVVVASSSPVPVTQ